MSQSLRCLLVLWFVFVGSVVAQFDPSAGLVPLKYEDIFEANKAMTRAQFASYVKELEGKEMEDRGRVGDVDENLGRRGGNSQAGVYRAYLFVKKNPPIRRSQMPGTAEVVLEVPQSAALRLNLDQFVRFRGTIASVHCRQSFCQVGLRNGTILATE